VRSNTASSTNQHDHQEYYLQKPVIYGGVCLWKSIENIDSWRRALWASSRRLCLYVEYCLHLIELVPNPPSHVIPNASIWHLVSNLYMNRRSCLDQVPLLSEESQERRVHADSVIRSIGNYIEPLLGNSPFHQPSLLRPVVISLQLRMLQQLFLKPILDLRCNSLTI
jgi:hypothetical protein